jgi:hypothetical protein
MTSQQASGDPHQGNRDEDLASVNERSVRRRAGSSTREGWTAKVQIAATVLAVLLTIPSVVFAFRTLKDQQEINRSQLAVAKIEQQRYQRRYASKISWWSEHSDSKVNDASVRIQNRSPVPLSGVVLEARPISYKKKTPARGFVLIGQIPPCTVLTLTIPASKFVGGDVWTTESLYFTDVVSYWVKSRAAVREAAILPVVQAVAWEGVSRDIIQGVWTYNVPPVEVPPNDAPIWEGDSSFFPVQARLNDASDCGEG